MDTESKECLTEWLMKNLEPICDAEPVVLSNYVLALVQSDPHKEGLHATCVLKLQEFLNDETETFVKLLLTTLKTQSYRSHHEDKPTTPLPDTKEDAVSRRDREDEDTMANPRSPKRAKSQESGWTEPFHRQNSHHPQGRANEMRPYGYHGPPNPRYDDRRPHDSRGRPPPRHGPQEGRYPPSSRRTQSPGRGSGSGSGSGPSSQRPEDYYGHEMPPQAYDMGGGYHQGSPHGYPHPHHPPHYDPRQGGPPPYMMYPSYPPPRGGMGGRGRGRGGRDGHAMGRGERDGPSRAAPTASASTRKMLWIANVDPKFTTLPALIAHFSRFGNVVNVAFRPDEKEAFVEYSTLSEATKAFQSPAAVCHNRFITVKRVGKHANAPAGTPLTVEEEAAEVTRLAARQANGDKEDEDQERPPVVSVVPLTPAEAKAAATDLGASVLKQQLELRDQKKELMAQKITLLTSSLTSYTQLATALEAKAQDASSCRAKLVVLTQELVTLQRALGQTPTVASNASASLSGLQSELSALQHQVSLGGRHAGGRGRGAGGRHTGGRGGRGSHRLDNRTRTLKVEALPLTAQDPSVLSQHFSSFGELASLVMDPTSNTTAYLSYTTRHGAEKAKLYGSFYGEEALGVAWIERSQVPGTDSSTTTLLTTATLESSAMEGVQSTGV